MTAQPLDLAAPPGLPSDADLAIPRGAEPESAIFGPVAGRYDLGDRIARGGMGIVYRAHDRLLNRTVAVKLMRGKYMDRPDLLRRFLGEARINGRLQHPGIVPVYEVGTLADSRPFIAMKLIEGQTLARLLRERSNPAENLAHFLKVFEALCQTMAYAHQQGVIHRDLKPDNVMVGSFGEVQVMDWGLAKYLDPTSAIAPTPDGFDLIEKSAFLSADGSTNTPTSDHPTQATAIVAVGPETPGVGYTTAGEVFGTLAYMPPEQARGEMDRVDRRSDVFSLGAILCEMLTGQPPYYGPPEKLREMSREGRLFGVYVLLDRCGADQALVLLAKHCLSVEHDSRPADAGVLADLVTECLEGLQDRTRQIEVKRLSAEARVAEAETREKLARQARRLARTLAVVGVMVAAMLAAGLGWYANDRFARDADETRRRGAALEQIESALSEADSLETQARTEPGTPLTRSSTARQAASACQRAEALVATVANVPNGVRKRLETTKARVAETERTTRLSIAVGESPTDLFDARGSFDGATAAKKCQQALSRFGIDVLGREPGAVVADIKVHPASAIVRDVLVDWLVVTPSDSERQLLSAVLNDSGNATSDAWLTAIHANDDDALARFAELSTESSVPASAVVIAANRLDKAGRAVDAQRVLQRWVNRYPNHFAINAHLGLLLRARPESHADAARYLTAARAARPDDPTVNLELGKVLAESGRTDEALDLLRAAVRNNPRLAEAHAQIGELLFGMGDAEAARTSYIAAVDADPYHVAALLGLGQLELTRGELDGAEKAFRAANQIKTNATATIGVGRVHLKRWEAAKATAVFRASVALEPKNAEARLGLVEALRMSNDIPAATGEAQAATEVIPTSAAAYRVLGDLLRSSNDKLGAAAAYRAAVQRDPADGDTRLRLAVMCEATDDFAGALQAYRAAADLRPMDAKIQANVVRLLSKTGDPSTTIETLRQMIAKEPKNALAHHQLGRLLTHRGDEKAISELTIASEIDSASGDIRRDLGNAYLKFARFRPAASAYRAAAERYPAESAKQIGAHELARKAMRLAGLESRLPEILSGTVTASTPVGWADFGEICRRTGRFAAAARFFLQSAKKNDKQLRPATICAALAGFNRGIDSKELSNAQRSDLRQGALANLSKNRAWTSDPELSPLRDPKSIENLAPAERDAWRTLFSGEVAGR